MTEQQCFLLPGLRMPRLSRRRRRQWCCTPALRGPVRR